MATFKFYSLASSSLMFLLFLFFFLFLSVASGSPYFCPGSTCRVYSSSYWPDIQFPFKIRGDDNGESDKYGYPGFEVFCGRNSENQTFIHLPNAGDFIVDDIAYSQHRLWIKDLDDCLPKRYLLPENIDLTGSLFQLSDDNLRLVNVGFYNYSNEDIKVHEPYAFQKALDCLGNGKTSVVTALNSRINIPAPTVNLSKCLMMSIASVPCSHLFDVKLPLFSTVPLKWTKPSCDYADCETDEMIHKYAVGIGVVLGAGIICFSVVACVIYTIKKMVNQNRVMADATAAIKILKESEDDEGHSMQPLIPSPMVRRIDYD